MSSEIADLLKEMHDSVAFLTRTDSELLARLAADPAAPVLHQRLKELLDFRFPTSTPSPWPPWAASR